MTLLRVWTDVGNRNPSALLARVVKEIDGIYTINYLSEDTNKTWRYETETYEIDIDSISENLANYDETDLGYTEFDGGFLKEDDDSDYDGGEEEEFETTSDSGDDLEDGSDDEAEAQDTDYENEDDDGGYSSE